MFFTRRRSDAQVCSPEFSSGVLPAHVQISASILIHTRRDPQGMVTVYSQHSFVTAVF